MISKIEFTWQDGQTQLRIDNSVTIANITGFKLSTNADGITIELKPDNVGGSDSMDMSVGENV